MQFKSGTWPSIIGIYLFGVCGASTVSKIIPLSEDIGRSFALSAADFGWLISFIAVPAAIFAIPSGVVVDRLGARRVLLLGALLGMAANALYFISPGLAFIQAARLLEGFAIVHIYTAGPALLMATTDGGTRTRAMTFWSTYAPVGTAAGLAIGGLFAQSEDWRNAFVLHGALFAIAGALCFLQPKLPTAQAGASATAGKRFNDLAMAFLSPKLLLLGLAFFLLVSMGLGANVTFPTHLAQVHAIPIGQSSNIVAGTTLAMILGSLAVGLLLPRGIRPLGMFCVLAFACFVAGALCFYPGISLSMRYATLLGWFIFTGAGMATLLAMLPMMAEAGRQGSAAALLNFAGALATVLNPPLWLAISASGEWTPFIGLMAAGWGLAAIFVWGSVLMLRRSSGSDVSDRPA